MKIKHASSTQLQNYRSSRMRDMIIGNIAEVPADVCVIGGDFDADLVSSIKSLAPIAERMPVVYVPGNLDFYSLEHTMEDILERAAELAERIGNVYLLSNTSAIIGDTRFIGATLWTDVTGSTPEEVLRINDFRSIRTLEGPWTVAGQKVEYDATVDFIESELAIRDGLATVVVTHNSPHASARDWRYPSPSPFFHANLGYLLEGPLAPDFWITGGIHVTAEWKIGDTMVVANGLGHPTRDEVAENFEDFDFNAVIETHPKSIPRPSESGPKP